MLDPYPFHIEQLHPLSLFSLAQLFLQAASLSWCASKGQMLMLAPSPFLPEQQLHQSLFSLAQLPL